MNRGFRSQHAKYQGSKSKHNNSITINVKTCTETEKPTSYPIIIPIIPININNYITSCVRNKYVTVSLSGYK